VVLAPAPTESTDVAAALDPWFDQAQVVVAPAESEAGATAAAGFGTGDSVLLVVVCLQ